MLPHQLYQFTTAKDAAGGRLEIAMRAVSSGATLATTADSPALVCPLDRVMRLGNLYAVGVAGAAQNALTLGFQVLDGAGNVVSSLCFIRQTSGTFLDLDRQLDIWLPAGFSVRGHATFSAGANANFCNFNAVGILFPRGNVQLGTFVV